jgi:hypothetical protein
MKNPPKLMEQVQSIIRVKRYSIRTEEAYMGWSDATLSFTTCVIQGKWASGKLRHFSLT